MKNTPEIYLIGQRIKRKILMIIIIISVLLGVIIGNACKSLVFGLVLSVVLAFFQIIMTKKYYWIISNQGIYTPLNFGIKKYLIIMLKYLLCGDDTGNIVFVNYRTIAYLNLFERKNKLWKLGTGENAVSDVWADSSLSCNCCSSEGCAA